MWSRVPVVDDVGLLSQGDGLGLVAVLVVMILVVVVIVKDVLLSNLDLGRVMSLRWGRDLSHFRRHFSLPVFFARFFESGKPEKY